MNQIWIGFAIAAFINMIFALISLATADWIHDNSDIPRSSSGLWQYCINGKCTSIPQDLLKHGDRTIRAFSILGFIASFSAFVSSALIVFGKGKPTPVVISFFCTGIFLIISMSIFTHGNNNHPFISLFSYGYSFILGWLACGFGILLGCAAAIVSKNNK